MFGFVSRKEFNKLVNQWNTNIKDMGESFTLLQARIAKLESSLNCRDGKHEWFGVSKHTSLGEPMYTVTTSVPDAACKHCGIKKAEWEKQTIKTFADACLNEKQAKELAELFIKTRKPQPKRKKGKK